MPKDSLTEEKKARFLKALIDTGGNVTRSSAKAKLDKHTLYDHRKTDEAFATAWDEARLLGIYGLEDEATRRAKDGVEEPVVYKGNFSGHWVDSNGNMVPADHPMVEKFVPNTITRYSDTLLMFLLKGAMPEKYRENVNLLNNGKDLPAPVVLYLPDNKREEVK